MKDIVITVEKGLIPTLKEYCKNINCELFFYSELPGEKYNVVVRYQVASQLFEIGLYLGAYRLTFISN